MASQDARADRPRHSNRDEPVGEREADSDDGGDNGDAAEDTPTTLRRRDDIREASDEQAEFRAQFDEDLYNDREDRPAQGNTADVAMEHRFGSDADAYAEYARLRPGDHRRGDESAVGQARDPADIADDEDAS